MCKIGECKMLLRAHVELPSGFKLATEEFREGWDIVRTSNAERLRRKTLTHGWTLVKIADEFQHGGVGETSQLAIASAVTLALRRVSEHCNAAEVAHVELTQYPWFFLARVQVYPYLIQKSSALPIYEDAVRLFPVPLQEQASHAAPDPYFRAAMPQLKQMLALSRSSQVGAQ